MEGDGLRGGGGFGLDLIPGRFHGGGQFRQIVGLGHGEGGGVFGKADLGGDALQRLQRSLDPPDAMVTHHAVNVQGDGLRGGRGNGRGGALLRQQGTFHRSDGRNGIHGGELRLPAAQPQGVADHAHRGKAHGGGGQHGAQFPAEGGVKHPGGNGDADGIIKECPEKILLDVAQDAAGKLQGGGDIGGVAVHQHDIGGVDGDIGAGTDGDADIGTHQGRGIINAVPHHGDDLALLLQGTDDCFLLLRQHLRDDPGDTDLRSNGLGGAAVVTGQQQNR